jgi:hypothetical protein
VAFFCGNPRSSAQNFTTSHAASLQRHPRTPRKTMLRLPWARKAVAQWLRAGVPSLQVPADCYAVDVLSRTTRPRRCGRRSICSTPDEKHVCAGCSLLLRAALALMGTCA